MPARNDSDDRCPLSWSPQPVSHRRDWRAFAAALILCLPVSGASAQPTPQVFNTPFYQAPVHARPGDLITLPGYGLHPGAQVVYQRWSPLLPQPSPPAAPPSSNTINSGLIELVDSGGTAPDSFNDAPYSITGRVPAEMSALDPYLLRVFRQTVFGGQWSEPVVVNDPRPLFVSPGLHYQTRSVGTNPRTLRVVGRNLAPWPRVTPQVRLLGSVPLNDLQLNAVAVPTELEDYVLEVDLPVPMVPDTYDVQVSLDGQSWYPVSQSSLEVVPTPVHTRVFEVADYGCEPDDGVDDTVCVRDALIDAYTWLQHWGPRPVVVFGEGRWDLINEQDAFSPISGGSPLLGLIVEPGIDLMGSATGTSELVRASTWVAHAMFTLRGNNEVSHLTLRHESGNERPPQYHTWALQLGAEVSQPNPEIVLDQVERVSIHECRFVEFDRAIGDAGYPIRDLFITDNSFEENELYALDLQGNGGNKWHRFTLEDAVVTDNTFTPGTFVYKSQGTVAGQIGGGRRVQFSRNRADGTVNSGWRAAFFWHRRGSSEGLLVSENEATCTSDLGGDGEFIALDSNAGVPGLEGAADVTLAGPLSVDLDQPLRAPDGFPSWASEHPDYFLDHWVFVVDGPGLGQARRITGYDSARASSVISIFPEWDVVPAPGQSRVVISRPYWNAYVVGNVVDNSVAAGCAGEAPQGEGGYLGLFGAASDSVIENNEQTYTGGIIVGSAYFALDPFPLIVDGVHQVDDKGNPIWVNHPIETTPVFASSIRGNQLLEEYGGGSTVSSAGIRIGYGSDAVSDHPVIGHNIAVAHNFIWHSEDQDTSAAINLRHTFHNGGNPETSGPAGGPTDNFRAISVYRNTVTHAPPEPNSPPAEQWAVSVWSSFVYSTSFADNLEWDHGTSQYVPVSTGLVNLEDKGHLTHEFQ